jgi:hypothetical protein
VRNEGIGFGRGLPHRFCSAGFRVRPSDEDGRLTTSGPIGAAQEATSFTRPRPDRRPGGLGEHVGVK